MSSHLRKAISQIVLRGKILEKWCSWKDNRVERILLRKMSEPNSSADGNLTRQPLTSKSLKLGTPLEKIVFIADIMWEGNELIPELQKICSVETLDLRGALRSRGETPAAQVTVRETEAFLNQHRDREPDLIFFYGRGGLLSEEVFSLLRKKWSCPLIGMNLDDKMTYWDYQVYSGGDEGYRKWASYFDLNITNSLIAADWYKAESVPVVYSPQGFRLVEGLNEPQSSSYRYPVSFLGSKKLDREAHVNALRGYGVAIDVFGQGWPESRWVENSVDLFRSTQINFGIGTATPHLSTVKGRDFECPSVGACYLTTYNWELSNWWEIGKEILCYRNIEEAVEVISYYQRRPEECLKIAQAAYRRAIREHTWEKRFRDLFREMGYKI